MADTISCNISGWCTGNQLAASPLSWRLSLPYGIEILWQTVVEARVMPN